jgi:ribosomal protein S14
MTEQYYKHYTKCKVCGLEYGYDIRKDNNICPICMLKFQKSNSMLDRVLKAKEKVSI